MGIDSAVGEPQDALPDLLDEQLADLFPAKIALRVMTDRRVREQVGEIVPEPKLRIVAVRVLEALDRANGLEPFRENGGRSDALLERR